MSMMMWRSGQRRRPRSTLRLSLLRIPNKLFPIRRRLPRTTRLFANRPTCRLRAHSRASVKPLPSSRQEKRHSPNLKQLVVAQTSFSPTTSRRHGAGVGRYEAVLCTERSNLTFPLRSACPPLSTSLTCSTRRTSTSRLKTQMLSQRNRRSSSEWTTSSTECLAVRPSTRFKLSRRSGEPELGARMREQRDFGLTNFGETATA